MKKGAEQWAKSRKIHEAIQAKVESMKRESAIKSARKNIRKSINNGR
jgi:hypothetical protein